MDDENTPDQPLKQRKPRTEAQIAALEKARLKAKEMREIRFKNVSLDEPEPEPEDEPEPTPIAEKKPRKQRVAKVKPSTTIEPEPHEEEEDEEPEREAEEVKQMRKEVQEAPPPTEKQHFRMIQSFRKSYMLYED